MRLLSLLTDALVKLIQMVYEAIFKAAAEQQP